MTKTKQEIINETMTVDKFVKQKCKEKGCITEANVY